MSRGMSDLNKVISAFTVYKFITKIITPFNRTNAYKYGIIDAKGNFLKDIKGLKGKEKESVDAFNMLIINLKKIIAKVPDPRLKAQLTTLPTAIFLVKEEVEKVGCDGQYFIECFKDYLIEEYNTDISTIFLNESFDSFDSSDEAIDCIFGVNIYRVEGVAVSALELN